MKNTKRDDRIFLRCFRLTMTTTVSLVHVLLLLSICTVCPGFCPPFVVVPQHPRKGNVPTTTWSRPSVTVAAAGPSRDAAGNDDDPTEWYSTAQELVNENDDDDDDDEEDWLPDRERALRKRRFAQEYYAQSSPERVNQIKTPTTTTKTSDQGEDESTAAQRAPVYTEEEEELILAMGGRTGGKREPGYLGDSTLAEIARDYSVPVCYIADVLCTWGVPIPININERLGDMVTGEQAFAILEAIHTLDVAVLQDRYSNHNLMELCDYYDMDIRDAFQMAIKEGWSLPFGVQTCLRVEQEQDLLRVLRGSYVAPDTEDDY